MEWQEQRMIIFKRTRKPIKELEQVIIISIKDKKNEFKQKKRGLYSTSTLVEFMWFRHIFI